MCQAECQTKSLDKESRVYHTDYLLEESSIHSIQADVAMTTFSMTRPLRQELFVYDCYYSNDLYVKFEFLIQAQFLTQVFNPGKSRNL